MILDKKYTLVKIFFNKSFSIGLIISSILMFLAFRSFNLENFFNAVANVNIFKLFFGSFLLMLAIYFRAVRWKYLINIEDIKINDLCKGQLIGCFINNILPLRIGEIAKAHYIGNKFNQSKSFIFGSVVLERLFDFFGLIFLLLILCNSIMIHVIIDNLLFTLFGVVIFSIIGILFLYFLRIEKFQRKLRLKLNLIFLDIVNGYSEIKNKNFLPAIILTIIIWIIYIIEVHLVQSAFNINLNIYESVFILFISSAFMILPAIPGNFGTFEGSIAYSFLLFEKYNIGNYVDDFGFSFILHLVSYLPYTFFGFIYCVQEFKFLLIKK